MMLIDYSVKITRQDWLDVLEIMMEIVWDNSCWDLIFLSFVDMKDLMRK